MGKRELADSPQALEIRMLDDLAFLISEVNQPIQVIIDAHRDSYSTSERR